MIALRSEIEDFLYREAELLDAWKLDEWLALFAENGSYYVPPTDKPEASHHDTLFIIADNFTRLRERVIRLKDPNCHAEYPPSRTRRMITNVRVETQPEGRLSVRANFVISRHRRDSDVRSYSGEYRNILTRRAVGLAIIERRAILDGHELGQMGAISFIL